MVSEDCTYVRSRSGTRKMLVSTLKVIKSVYVIVIKSARLDLTVKVSGIAIGVLYSSF